MSGRKLTPMQIMQREIDNMMSQLQRSEEAERELAWQMQQAQEQMQSEMDQALRAQELRNQRQADQTRREMQQIEHGMQQQINGVWEQMQEGFRDAYERDQQLQQNIEEVHRQAFERDQQLQQNIARVREEMRRGQAQLQAQIDTMEGRHSNASEAASSWCDEAERIVDHIRTTLRHEKFTPGALAGIEQKLRLAQSNRSTPGLENAALSGAQGAYLEAQHLRLQIEAAEAEWQARVNAAKGLALRLEAEWEVNQNPRFQFETEEGTKDLEGSVDDWTGGEYAKVREQLDSVRMQLDHSDSMTLEQVKGLEQHLAGLQQEQVRVVNLARQAIIASQLRVDMATIVAETLQQQGWHVVDSAYEGEEHTNALHVKLQMGQDEMVITYTPQQSEEAVTNSVETAFFDRTTNDEEFRRSRMESIENALRSVDGVECGRSQCVPGTEDQPCSDQKMLDFEQVRKRKRRQKESARPGRDRSTRKGRVERQDA